MRIEFDIKKKIDMEKEFDIGIDFNVKIESDIGIEFYIEKERFDFESALDIEYGPTTSL